MGMARNNFVTLDGYMVAGTTTKAVAVRKAKDLASAWHWLPRSMCDGGEVLEVGDTDIVVRENMAEEKGLNWR
jgi:hypothetical protein